MWQFPFNALRARPGLIRKLLVGRIHDNALRAGYQSILRVLLQAVVRATRPRQQVIGGMVREFVDRVFDGASRPMLLHLVKHTRLSDKERKALLRVIEEADE